MGVVNLTRRSVDVVAHPGQPIALELDVGRTGAGVWFGADLTATVAGLNWSVDASYSATKRRVSLTGEQTATLGAGRYPYTVSVGGNVWFTGTLTLSESALGPSRGGPLTVNIASDTATVAVDVGPVAPPCMAAARLAAAAATLDGIDGASDYDDVLSALVALRGALGGAAC